MKMKKILLNCMPPVSIRRPGYSLSVIKSFLMQEGYCASIKYWNITLRRLIERFWFNEYHNIHVSSIIKDLMPFYSYYAITRGDEKIIHKIEQLLLKYFPKKNIGNHLAIFKESLYNEIIVELKKIDIKQYQYVYVQSKFYKYQLVSTGVLCEIIKKEYPHIVTIIEAQEFDRKALALIDSFPCYDFATFGEYELSLTRLLDELNKENVDYADIPNIAYRDMNGMAQISTKRIKNFIDLNRTPFADFSDYIEQTSVDKYNIIFPLEGGRGCHWNSCSFCYMNDGYQYRRKTPERMSQEIAFYLKKYSAKIFYYIDNDIVGHDVKAFEQLLDYYIELRKHNNFYIDFGEIIAKDVDADLLKKMHNAGFQQIQIGYESTSDRVLKNIHKKSHFAHLILVCKWCFHYGIQMSPQNILRSLPFETDELILESINNLYFLRFLLSKKGFEHSLRLLCVVSTSRYYSRLVDAGEIDKWNYTPMQEFMIDDFIKAQYKYDVFLMQTNIVNPLWDLFRIAEKYYKDYTYDYVITSEKNNLYYIERQQGQIIRRKEVSLIEQTILKYCNRKVCCMNDLLNSLKGYATKESISEAVHNLAILGVLYVSDQYDEIVSIINFGSNEY